VPWSAVDLDLTAGVFEAGDHGWTSGADSFELEVGNTIAWSHPLLRRGGRYDALCDEYLPYYDRALRHDRLAMVIRYARNNLEHVVPYALRNLGFQAYKRLHHAIEEYLQALFIERRIYALAYDKWIREQLEFVLQEPGIYEELASILPTPSLRVHRLADRAARLGALVDALDVSD
jgi:hypothetical protein